MVRLEGLYQLVAARAGTVVEADFAASPLALLDNGLGDGSGTGRSLPSTLLIIAAVSSLSATFLSLVSIYTHLKQYLKPHLQRHVIRLLLIVPIYSTSSLIGLFSLPAAFLIDLLRDLYEAFAIYSFFELLVAYLGGERSTLILMIGRKPVQHPWPFRIFLREMDMSDPYTFLAIKRGVLQYVQIKPILALATVILKSIGKYEEGELSGDNGYTYISIVYNISIFLSLYCLALFWSALSSELTPFRPTAKFLTVKGVVFATFWQGWAISVVVAAGAIKSIGPISDPSFLRLGLQDLLLTLEMPLFALGHMYAFSPRDYVDHWATYQARLPITYALRDALGARDVSEDIKSTMRGTGYGYARFEPARGALHQGLARSRRLQAGLRYTDGGKGKYFLPAKGLRTTGGSSALPSSMNSDGSRLQGPVAAIRQWVDDRRMSREGFARMSAQEEAEVLHDNEQEEEHGSLQGKDERRRKAEAAARKLGYGLEAGLLFFAERPEPGDEDSVASLSFHSPASNVSEENGYTKAKHLDYGDYAFPTIACNNAQKFKDPERGGGSGERQWLLGGQGSRREESLESRSRDRKRRVEGWLDKMRSIMSSETSDEDEGSDSSTDSPGAKQGKGQGKTDEGRKRTVWGGMGSDGEDEGEEQNGSSSKSQPSKSPPTDGRGRIKDRRPSTADSKHKKDPQKLSAPSSKQKSKSKSKSKSPRGGRSPHESDEDGQAEEHGAVDLIVSDPIEEERHRAIERRRGDPALRTDRRGQRVFRKVWQGPGDSLPTSGPSSSTTTTGTEDNGKDSKSRSKSKGKKEEKQDAKEREKEEKERSKQEKKDSKPHQPSQTAPPQAHASQHPPRHETNEQGTTSHLTDVASKYPHGDPSTHEQIVETKVPPPERDGEGRISQVVPRPEVKSPAEEREGEPTTSLLSVHDFSSSSSSSSSISGVHVGEGEEGHGAEVEEEKKAHPPHPMPVYHKHEEWSYGTGAGHHRPMEEDSTIGGTATNPWA